MYTFCLLLSVSSESTLNIYRIRNTGIYLSIYHLKQPFLGEEFGGQFQEEEAFRNSHHGSSSCCLVTCIGVCLPTSREQFLGAASSSRSFKMETVLASLNVNLTQTSLLREGNLK